MIAQQDRIQIWASQLTANDFPPVCAMTGRPAETWKRFNFQTPPGWTYALFVLVLLGLIGIVVAGVVIYFVSEKASGHLPLTRAARNRLLVILWTIVALLPLSVIFLIAGAAFGAGTDSATSGLGVGCILLGVLAFIAFVVGAVLRNRFGPRGKVHAAQAGYFDKIIELSHLHPNFVAAIQQQHASRVARLNQQA